jgi:hypothetical protein
MPIQITDAAVGWEVAPGLVVAIPTAVEAFDTGFFWAFVLLLQI